MGDKAVPNDKIQPIQPTQESSAMAHTAVENQAGGAAFAAMKKGPDNPMGLPDLYILTGAASNDNTGSSHAQAVQELGQIKAPDSVYKDVDASMAKMDARTDATKQSLTVPELQAVQAEEKSILTGAVASPADTAFSKLTDANTAAQKFGDNAAMMQTTLDDLTSIGVPAQLSRFKDAGIQNQGEVIALSPPGSKVEHTGTPNAEIDFASYDKKE